jgi:hypothetical protein
VQFGTPLQSSAEAVPILAMKKYQAIYGSQLNIYLHLVLEGVRNIIKPFWYSSLGLSLLMIGVAAIMRRKTLTNVERITYLLVLGGVLLLTVHTLFRGFIRDWYVLELVPLFIIAFGIAIATNAGRSEVRTSGRLLFASVILVGLWFLYPSKRMTSQYDMVYRGGPTVEALTRDSKVAAFNTGYYSYFANRPGSMVDLDGVVSAEAVDAIKHGDLHGYLDRANVDYVFDFEGDFGGYINLIDRHLLDSFTLVARDTTASGAMVLYKRKVN